MGSGHGVCMRNLRIVRQVYGKRLNKKSFRNFFFLRNEFLLKGRGHLAKSSNCAGNILASHMSD